MSAFKHLLNRAHYCSTKSTRPAFYFRPFCSSPLETTPPIKPVYYEPKSPPPPPSPPSESQAQGPTAQPPNDRRPENLRAPHDARPETLRAWTREDFRYVKDGPTITPVSYAPRVAPLPEDRAGAEEAKGDNGMNVIDDLESQRRRIEDEGRNVMRRAYSVEVEKVPFPSLVRVEKSKKEEKVVHDLKEAIRLLKANAKAKFLETVEAHVKLTPDLRKSHLNLSGSVLLPHGCGKKYQIAVFAEGDAAEEAREAGAACVGGKELVDSIKSGEVKFKFDKCFATHEMMVHVKKIGRFLKRGMMPNPEHGTLTDNMSKAVKEAISNQIIFQKDKSAIVHVPLGKVTFADEALRENIGAFANALLHAKPAGLKKTSKYAGYISSFHICSSMGQSYAVTIQSVSMAVDRYNKLRLHA